MALLKKFYVANDTFTADIKALFVHLKLPVLTAFTAWVWHRMCAMAVLKDEHVSQTGRAIIARIIMR